MFYVADKTDFNKIYSIMEYSFPESERRSRKDQCALMDDERYKIIYKRGNDGEICAFIAYWQLENAVFAEHFAVASTMRGAGLGGAFLDEFLSSCGGEDVLEVERPENDIAVRRIAFYERHGFVLNTFDYVQPPLGEGRSPAPLYLMSRGERLTKEKFEYIRSCIYRTAYKTDGKAFIK